MAITLRLVLLGLAFLFFLLAAIGVSSSRVSLTDAGLALLAAAFIAGGGA